MGNGRAPLPMSGVAPRYGGWLNLPPGAPRTTPDKYAACRFRIKTAPGFAEATRAVAAVWSTSPPGSGNFLSRTAVRHQASPTVDAPQHLTNGATNPFPVWPAIRRDSDTGSPYWH